MTRILSIETATNICSIAIHENETCIHISEISEPQAHSAKLTVLIEEMLAHASFTIKDFDAIAISEGPGSYTGLRIGTSVAKGLCYAADLPLITINTLEALALQYTLNSKKSIPENAILCPMIDARRMEVYTAQFDAYITQLQKTHPLVVTEETIQLFESHKSYYLFGDGSQKLQEILSAPHIHFVPNITCSSESVGQIAYSQYKQGNFADVAYFEPFYLKNFQATTPKKQL
ncbi:MAG: tRNA (adenosine(37)-N6)-threonylcarbamoyltransferase complex dimerization subunit type 1 TsaB [Bacteroidales bacterium]|jgi:tRNA threonylcarbamoyladenosine biosynthesis protein TsaB|nr:tRNA (adenosine(37)-N6)-threonylcarbamoyltransferase complex dimerization subunit type 1 TsaB [Bacteroidales bacterium]